MTLDDFRSQTRDWLEVHCPASMRTRIRPGEEVNGGRKRQSSNPEAYLWLDRMAERGWTAPTWPVEYGGGGLSPSEFKILVEELQRIQARPPLGGMGLSMIGPTLLEYGTDAQKARHLPKIARGEIAWCQGYSEPGAGSDLASLQTKAEDCGDHYLVNGGKIWTSGALHADWIFCLVRTRTDVPKHEGISFLLFSMDSPGVTVKPIQLINGDSPFCQTFFDNVQVPKDDLVHQENQGWTVAKRLLQHERSGLSMLANADTAGPLERIKPNSDWGTLIDHYLSENVSERAAIRGRISEIDMLRRSFLITQKRALAERQHEVPGAATSIFKYVEAELVKSQLEMQQTLRGSQALGWRGEGFSDEELKMNRLNYEAKSISIAGGSNEIQLNIIAKRVLGLPD